MTWSDVFWFSLPGREMKYLPTVFITVSVLGSWPDTFQGQKHETVGGGVSQQRD